jgi:hypothetical protein
MRSRTRATPTARSYALLALERPTIAAGSGARRTPVLTRRRQRQLAHDSRTASEDPESCRIFPSLESFKPILDALGSTHVGYAVTD